jgi:MFS family permease
MAPTRDACPRWTTRRTASRMSRVSALFFLCLAELLILSLWFSSSAVLPALVATYGLGDSGRAGLTMAVQSGFIIGTLLSALFNVPDLLSPRWLMLIGGLVGAAANAAVAAWLPALPLVLLLRFVTGVAMALAYPPAMKIMATWWKSGRGLAIGMLIAALTLGSASPHLLRGVSGLSFRAVLFSASGLALGGVLLCATVVREGPFPFPRARLDLRRAAGVLRERGLRLMCFGYFGHMWELYAMWAWLAAFLDASLVARGQAGASYLGLNFSLATFVAMGIGGAIGAAGGGILAERIGRTALCAAAMAASGICAVLIGFSFGGAPWLTMALAFLWGVTVIADSAQFSAGVTELCEPAYVGTALTAQTCVGFAITLLSIWLIPKLAAAVGWRFAFATLAVGPFLGVGAMLALRRLPEAAKLAQGKR